MYDITPIIEAVAALIGVIVTCVLIPFIKSKTTASQQAEINAWVKIAVSAAEQIFKGSGRGEEKKQYVIAWLKERGVTVNENELDALIEAGAVSAERTENGVCLSCPFSPHEPFALAPAFVLCRAEQGRAVLDWKTEGAAESAAPSEMD